jgi:hypothetical protein
MGSWEVWAGLAQSINGTDYAHGLTFTVGGLFRFDWQPGSDYDDDYDTYQPEPYYEKSSSKKEDDFDSGNEQYDHKLFKEASPVKPEDEFDESINTVKKKEMKSRGVKPKKKGPSTEKMLDDVEKQLEKGL